MSHDYGKEFESSVFAQVNGNFLLNPVNEMFKKNLQKVNKLYVDLHNYKKSKEYAQNLKISYFWTSGPEFRFSMVDIIV